MTYNFDTVVDRHGTASIKYDALLRTRPGVDENTIPLMVADMDFRTAQPVIDALHRVADYGMWGYTSIDGEPRYRKAVCRWFYDHHAWKIQESDIFYSNGTIEALSSIIRAFSNVGDGVILCRPVYGHFTQAIEEECHRKAVDSHLIAGENGGWTMDFDDIEEKCADPANRIFLLCNPHNPIGRVWTENELSTLDAICKEYNVLLVSDEVHCDIVRRDVHFCPLGRVVEDWSNVIVLTAVNKSFNLAGLMCSNAIIPDAFLQARFLREFGRRQPTPFAIAALVAAYEDGDEWLEQMNDYIDANINWVLGFLREKMPLVKAYRPEGTYCLWLDFSQYGLSDKEIHHRIYDKANVLLQDGTVHDPVYGACCQRVCLPAARSVIEEAFTRIAAQF